MKNFGRLLALAASLAAFPLRANDPPPFYSITEVCGTTGVASEARQLNDHGDVVGRIKLTAEGSWLPFIYLDHNLVVLGPEKGVDMGVATAISNTGVAVGIRLFTSGFVYDGGDLKFIADWRNENVGFGVVTEVLDINAAGIAVGYSGQPGFSKQIAVRYAYSPTALHPVSNYVFWLSKLAESYPRALLVDGGSYSHAYAVNESGVIVAGAASGAIMVSGGVETKIPGMNEALAINDAGDIVGSGPSRYKNGMLEDLSATAGTTLSGFAVGISDSGTVLISDSHPLLTSTQPSPWPAASIFSGEKIYALADLIDPAAGLTITRAARMNARGQIAATAVDATGSTHAVLLTPQTWPEDRPTPAPIVEPSPTPTPSPTSTPQPPPPLPANLRPSLSVAPVPKKVHAASHVIRGSVFDDQDVVRIEIRQKGQRRKLRPSGTMRWAFRVKLHPGPNVLTVTALDDSGTRSRPVRIRITRIR